MSIGCVKKEGYPQSYPVSRTVVTTQSIKPPLPILIGTLAGTLVLAKLGMSMSTKFLLTSRPSQQRDAGWIVRFANVGRRSSCAVPNIKNLRHGCEESTPNKGQQVKVY